MRRATASAALLFVLAIGTPLYAEFPKAPPPKPASVIIGIYVTHIYDLNPGGNSFTVGFWAWARRRSRDIHPLDTLQIFQAKEVKAEPTVSIEKGGEIWDQRYFRAVIRYSWDMREYPFDEYNLPLEFGEGIYDTNALTYVADTRQSGIEPDAMPAHWRITRFRFDTGAMQYPSTFGDPTLTKPLTSMAFGKAVVEVERQHGAIFFKLLIGAYVAFLLAVISYRIKADQPTLFSARIGLLVGSLFATIVNLRSTESVLGRTEDFTLVDKIHLLITVYILIAAMSALLSRRLCERERIEKSREIDGLSFILFTASFIAINIVMISHAVMY
jgi:hypothetical protein